MITFVNIINILIIFIPPVVDPEQPPTNEDIKSNIGRNVGHLKKLSVLNPAVVDVEIT